MFFVYPEHDVDRMISVLLPSGLGNGARLTLVSRWLAPTPAPAPAPTLTSRD